MKHIELEPFLHAFASHGFVSVSWATFNGEQDTIIDMTLKDLENKGQSLSSV